MWSGHVFSGQEWNQIHTIEIIRLRFDTSQLCRSCRNVQRTDWMVVKLSSRDSARPRDNERNVHSTFGQHAFLAVKRVVE